MVDVCSQMFVMIRFCPSFCQPLKVRCRCAQPADAAVILSMITKIWPKDFLGINIIGKKHSWLPDTHAYQMLMHKKASIIAL